jgi:hypothetical protein
MPSVCTCPPNADSTVFVASPTLLNSPKISRDSTARALAAADPMSSSAKEAGADLATVHGSYGCHATGDVNMEAKSAPAAHLHRSPLANDSACSIGDAERIATLREGPGAHHRSRNIFLPPTAAPTQDFMVETTAGKENGEAHADARTPHLCVHSSGASSAASAIFNPSLSEDEVRQRIRIGMGNARPFFDFVEVARCVTSLERSVQEVRAPAAPAHLACHSSA